MHFRTLLLRTQITLFKLACALAPKKRNKVCFISYPDYADNSLAMHEYIKEHYPEIKRVWLYWTDRKPQKALEGTSLSKKNSFRGIWHFITASVVFHTHGSYRFARNAGPCQISLWHGMPIKNIGFLDKKSESEVPYANVSIATSPYFQKIISTSFGLPKDRVWLTGLPRNDRLNPFNQNAYASIVHSLGFREKPGIIFWLPTYRTSTTGDVRKDSIRESFLNEWPNELWEKLDGTAKANNKAIIVKLHPMDALNRAQLEQNFSNVKFLKTSDWNAIGIDLYDALSTAEALISDISSVIIDFIVTGKPIAITTESLHEYTRGKMGRTNELLAAFKKINCEQDLIAFVSCPKDHPINSDLAQVFYSQTLQDSSACKRVMENTISDFCFRD